MTYRYKLDIEYDGTHYCGWQRQADVVTIQEVIENNLQELNKGKPVNLYGAGRTDSGVHALHQVAHFDLDQEWSPLTLGKALQARTPRDIVIHDCEPVSSDYHARYSARRRHYFYQITPIPTAVFRHFTWYVYFNINSELLNRCARLVIGEHNFEGFCRTLDESKSKICRIHESAWKNENKMLIYKISGNRFLHSMVRMLVGTMIEVARARFTMDDFYNILHQKEPDRQALTAPAQGLFLSHIDY